MPAPIRYYDRYKQTVETEQVYGQLWLRLAYGNPVGRALVWLLIRRTIFSWAYGWQMNKRVSAGKVLPFIVEYNLNVEEFAKTPFDYKSFNEFFCRALKPEARPITPDQPVGAAGSGQVVPVAVLPADGRHLVFPNVETAEGFYVKGAKFTVAELLGDTALAEKFAGGAMLISRLCPVDYHRFHFPVAGVPSDPEAHQRQPLFGEPDRAAAQHPLPRRKQALPHAGRVASLRDRGDAGGGRDQRRQHQADPCAGAGRAEGRGEGVVQVRRLLRDHALSARAHQI
jgi:hypothetical protein